VGTRYIPSPALLTDLYQLTMAYGYWKVGMADHRAAFHLFFRKNPFKGGYAIAAGLSAAVGLLERWRFGAEDLTFLAGLTGNDGKPLFEQGFLDYLRDTPLSIDVDAIPEGTAVFPHQPMMRLTGSLIQCQLLETPLLTLLNFQTLIATKSSRICRAASGESVLEFGLRRAQGVDGGLAASRAAYIGGCHATSNVLAGKLYDIPIKGTHAHSWVMAFPTERAAFEAYAEAMPNNCVFLVDTYDTVQGVQTAVEVGLALRERGYEMSGIRLDSGDLAALSQAARKILDEGGFPDAAIVASDGLDEHRIAELKARGSCITVWGVGTNLSTAKDQPALGGVYKLAAIAAPGEPWAYRIKLSEHPIKVSNPGIQQVRRYTDADGRFLGDQIFEIDHGADHTLESLANPGTTTTIPADAESTDLLQPVYRAGERVWEEPSIHTVRDRTAAQLANLPDGVVTGTAEYPVGLSPQLSTLKASLMAAARRS
jgi:nicotinate phosphoribosyltransferase